MTKFLEMFEPIQKGNFGLTEESTYKSIQAGEPFIPLWGGNQEHISPERMVSSNGKTKHGEPIIVFEGEGIIISLDGSAGCMTYKNKQKFALNHHAGFFKVKEDAITKIIPEFFVYFYETELRNESVSEGSKTLTLDQIYNLDFDVPDYVTQKGIMSQIKPLLEKKRLIEQALQNINITKDKFFSNLYKKYQAKSIAIFQVIDYLSGNSGLTERVIYQKMQQDGKRYAVLSSSTEAYTKMGELPKCDINGKLLKVFENNEGLLVVRNGKAGTTMYLQKGDYTINDHAYILFVKDDCPYKINLKWLSIQYKADFLSYSSSSDNGTWNMSGFFQNVIIDIPEYNEQLAVIKEYERLEWYENGFKEIHNKIEAIFSKIIV